MVKLLWVLCVLALCVVGKSASQPDCTSVMLGLADCLSFVQNGSVTTKPQGTCCSGLKTVVKDNPSCLCQAFNGNSNFGIALNMTKAMTLPTACGVTTPPVSNCAVVGHPPGAAPAPAPKKSHKKNPPAPSPSAVSPAPVPISPSPSASPFIPVAPAGAPSTGSNVAGANAPSPAGVSSAIALPVSFAVVLVNLAVAVTAYF